MQLHQLKPQHRRPKGKRIGRGGKKGMSSGRGGQKLGASQPRIREVLKRYPKLRGYRFAGAQSARQVVSLQKLESAFNAGDTVNSLILSKKGLVRTIQGKNPEVKILGGGTITKALHITGCLVSQSAKKSIEQAGGSITQ